MPETLDQYRNRTAFMRHSLPGDGLITAPGLVSKVDAGGALLPFYGDTTLFSLPPALQRYLMRMQDALYAAAGHMLAQRLEPDTLHITLHDLCNSPRGWPAGLPGNRKRTLPLLQQARQTLPAGIRIRSVCPFSMVNTSIVLGFEPAREQDCRILMSLYDSLQRVRPLSYPLTLHATLAYYRPGAYADTDGLRAALAELARAPEEWELEMAQLDYALFDSMNRYLLIRE